MADAQRRPGAEEVVLAQPDAARILSAGAGDTDARDERPAVSRQHLDVDDAVLVGDRADLHVVEIARAAQQALGLLDHRRRHPVSALEQERVLDDACARLDVQCVRPSVERPVFLRVLGVEDVGGADPHFADARLQGFELGEGRRRCRQRLGGDRHRQAGAERQTRTATSHDTRMRRSIRPRIARGAGQAHDRHDAARTHGRAIVSPCSADSSDGRHPPLPCRRPRPRRRPCLRAERCRFAR